MGGGANLHWASFLVTRRAAIDRTMLEQARGEGPGIAEAETLRRFRSFVTASLRRGDGGEPALDGLRVPEDVSLVCTDADPHFDWCRPSEDCDQPAPRPR